MLRILILIIAFVFSGCMHGPSVSAESTETSAETTGQAPAKPAPSAFDDNPHAQVTNDELQGAETVVGISPVQNLRSYDEIRFDVRNADIELKSVKAKTGSMQIQKKRGGNECQVQVVKSKSRLTLVEHYPLHTKCKFDISLELPAASDLNVKVSHGKINVSNWVAPVHLSLSYGEIAFDNIGPLQVECVSCILSGNEVHGVLKYKLKTGNVGVEGLQDTVEGTTLGDTVLEWQKFSPGSKVSIVSKAGDVVLKVPSKSQLALDLVIPKGEFTTNLMPYQVVQNSQELRSGVPFAVTAETGNVRIIH